MKRTAVVGIALVALVGCEASPAADALDELVNAREAASISACHDLVRAGGVDICTVASGTERGAVVQPAPEDVGAPSPAAVTTRLPDRWAAADVQASAGGAR